MKIRDLSKLIAGTLAGAAFVTTLAAGCAAVPEREGVGESIEELRAKYHPRYCETNCNCPLGEVCDYLDTPWKICHMPLDFGPLPPFPYCYATCQCGYGEVCDLNGGYQGSCQPIAGHCTSDCDCGVTAVCVNNQCELDFGPFPGCRCDAHCGQGEYCDGAFCAPE